MEIFAGAGDRFQLDVTPPSITSLVMHNASMAVQDLVYIATWAVPIALIGNFSVFAGQRINSNGTVDRLKRLLNIHSAITLQYHGNAPSQIVFDGDLDAPGAHYSIPSGSSVSNDTVGLSVSVSGYRAVDTFYIYMPGATVDANLQSGSPAKFYFDGKARLAGTNPTSPNAITIAAPYGNATMTPLAQYDSLIALNNLVHILGAMPQDNLIVNQPTNVVLSPAMGHDFQLMLNPNSWAEVLN